MVFTIAIGLLSVREEAEEASQDAFVKAYRALNAFKKESKFSTWLYRIVYNECITRLRKRKNGYQSLDDNIAMDESFLLTEEKENRDERAALMHKALGDLPEEDRALIMMYYFEGAGIDEISEISSLSLSNVKTRLFRIRKKLYDKLQLKIEALI